VCYLLLFGSSVLSIQQSFAFFASVIYCVSLYFFFFFFFFCAAPDCFVSCSSIQTEKNAKAKRINFFSWQLFWKHAGEWKSLRVLVTMVMMIMGTRGSSRAIESASASAVSW